MSSPSLLKTFIVRACRELLDSAISLARRVKMLGFQQTGQAPRGGAQTLLSYLDDFLEIAFAVALAVVFVGFNFFDNLDFILEALFL